MQICIPNTQVYFWRNAQAAKEKMHSLKQFAISVLPNALTEKNSSKKFNLHEKKKLYTSSYLLSKNCRSTTPLPYQDASRICLS